MFLKLKHFKKQLLILILIYNLILLLNCGKLMSNDELDQVVTEENLLNLMKEETYLSLENIFLNNQNQSETTTNLPAVANQPKEDLNLNEQTKSPLFDDLSLNNFTNLNQFIQKLSKSFDLYNNYFELSKSKPILKNRQIKNSINNLRQNLEKAYNCGINRFNNEALLSERILGGNDAHLGEFPWQVTIRLVHPEFESVVHWCGGVLVSSRWVMTASHCIINSISNLSNASYWKVRLGKHYLQSIETTEHVYNVVKVFRLSSSNSYENDLALLKLGQKVRENLFIRKICLPFNIKLNLSIHDCFVSGWGKTKYKNNSDNLQKLRVKFYNNSDCQALYYPTYRINIKNSHLCVGSKSGGKGTCHGDSGGPLQCKIRNKWYLIGITSFGSNCAKRGYPDVFTNVFQFLNWTKNIINKE